MDSPGQDEPSMAVQRFVSDKRRQSTTTLKPGGFAFSDTR